MRSPDRATALPGEEEPELSQTGLRRRGESSAIATGRLPSLRLFSTPLTSLTMSACQALSEHTAALTR